MTPDLSTADLTNAAAGMLPDERRDEQQELDIPAKAATDAPMALFAEQQVTELRTRWDQIQAGFVDEPRGAVEKSQTLLADAEAQAPRLA